jgi:serine phosphatase RsbU (regulator of sigma subunit)
MELAGHTQHARHQPIGRRNRPLRFAAAQHPPPGRSGDFCQVRHDRDDSSTFFFGDVSGNGDAVAPIAERVRAIVDRRVEERSGPAALLTAVNQDLYGRLRPECFVSAVVARIEWRRASIRLASAGHLGPFVRGRSGQVIAAAGPGGPPLGIVERQSYAEYSRNLALGDTVVFASDGVTDRFASPSDPLGEIGLMNRLSWAAHLDLSDLCQCLLDSTRGHSDASVLAVRLI